MKNRKQGDSNQRLGDWRQLGATTYIPTTTSFFFLVSSAWSSTSLNFSIHPSIHASHHCHHFL